MMLVCVAECGTRPVILANDMILVVMVLVVVVVVVAGAGWVACARYGSCDARIWRQCFGVGVDKRLRHW